MEGELNMDSTADIRDKFSTNLLLMLKRTNITKAELARRIDATDTTINRYINGTAEPKLTMLYRIAEVFDCSIDDLIF